VTEAKTHYETAVYNIIAVLFAGSVGIVFLGLNIDNLPRARQDE